MISTSVESPRWSHGKVWTAIVIVFALQAALIFGLGHRSAATPRPVVAAPAIHLNRDSGDLLALLDPTLFALPHRQGFSGVAWLQVPRQQFRPADWSEKPRWLSLAPHQLGAAFREFVRTNAAPQFDAVAIPESGPAIRDVPVQPILTRSSLRLEGELAERGLRSRFELRGWPSAELLTNSVVQVLVDAQGKTVSPPVLLSGCGLPDADRAALELARTARFAPSEITGPGRAKNRREELTLGKLVFEWQTLPATNSTLVAP